MTESQPNYIYACRQCGSQTSRDTFEFFIKCPFCGTAIAPDWEQYRRSPHFQKASQGYSLQDDPEMMAARQLFSDLAIQMESAQKKGHRKAWRHAAENYFRLNLFINPQVMAPYVEAAGGGEAYLRRTLDSLEITYFDRWVSFLSKLSDFMHWLFYSLWKPHTLLRVSLLLWASRLFARANGRAMYAMANPPVSGEALKDKLREGDQTMMAAEILGLIDANNQRLTLRLKKRLALRYGHLDPKIAMWNPQRPSMSDAMPSAVKMVECPLCGKVKAVTGVHDSLLLCLECQYYEDPVDSTTESQPKSAEPAVCAQCGNPLSGDIASEIFICGHCGTRRALPADPGSARSQIQTLANAMSIQSVRSLAQHPRFSEYIRKTVKPLFKEMMDLPDDPSRIRHVKQVLKKKPDLLPTLSRWSQSPHPDLDFIRRMVKVLSEYSQ